MYCYLCGRKLHNNDGHDLRQPYGYTRKVHFRCYGKYRLKREADLNKNLKRG